MALSRLELVRYTDKSITRDHQDGDIQKKPVKLVSSKLGLEADHPQTSLKMFLLAPALITLLLLFNISSWARVSPSFEIIKADFLGVVEHRSTVMERPADIW